MLSTNAFMLVGFSKLTAESGLVRLQLKRPGPEYMNPLTPFKLLLRCEYAVLLRLFCSHLEK